jgi:hypothetical protein
VYPDAAIHEGSRTDLDGLAAVLRQVVAALDADKIPYLLIGGLASSLLGRPRCSSDIDILVRPESARPALAALAEAGFDTLEKYPHWLYKAYRDDALVDVIFKCHGDIYLDDLMLEHSRLASFRGTQVRIAPREDLIVVKAIVHEEHMPRHWHDALALLVGPMDWEYFLHRARKGPRRLLSLLLYAESSGIAVPRDVMKRLAEDCHL